MDARHARLSIISAGANYRRAVVGIDFGARHFEVEMSSYDNRIRLVEITTHKKFGFDPRNPLNGYAMKDVRSERVLQTHCLTPYLTAEKKE